MKTITCARCKSKLLLMQYTYGGKRNAYYLHKDYKEFHEVENLYFFGAEPQVMITECRRVSEA